MLVKKSLFNSAALEMRVFCAQTTALQTPCNDCVMCRETVLDDRLNFNDANREPKKPHKYLWSLNYDYINFIMFVILSKWCKIYHIRSRSHRPDNDSAQGCWGTLHDWT